MQAEAVNPETGERFAFEISPEELEQLVRDVRPRLSKKKLERQIDKLAISAEAKVRLALFMSVTVKIGNAVLNIGRRILEIVFDLVKRYPNFTFAVVMYLVGSLLAHFCSRFGSDTWPTIESDGVGFRSRKGLFGTPQE